MFPGRPVSSSQKPRLLPRVSRTSLQRNAYVRDLRRFVRTRAAGVGRWRARSRGPAHGRPGNSVSSSAVRLREPGLSSCPSLQPGWDTIRDTKGRARCCWSGFVRVAVGMNSQVEGYYGSSHQQRECGGVGRVRGLVVGERADARGQQHRRCRGAGDDQVPTGPEQRVRGERGRGRANSTSERRFMGSGRWARTPWSAERALERDVQRARFIDWGDTPSADPGRTGSRPAEPRWR
jgi:hypothetical protein